MGGRGASSGISDNGKPYGSEFTTLLQSGNIKFITYNDGAAKSPMETMTKNRIYVTIEPKTNLPKFITFYDKGNKRYKQIDIRGKAHIINGKPKLPHKHLGYEHNENGDYDISDRDRRLIDRVNKIWYAHHSR